MTRLPSPRIRGMGVFVIVPVCGLVIVSADGSAFARLAGAAARTRIVAQAVRASVHRAVCEAAAEGIVATSAFRITWLSRRTGHRLGFVRRQARVSAPQHTAAVNGKARVLPDLLPL